MTVWSLEGGRLFPVEDQLEQKQRTGKGKACFPAPSPPAPKKRALYFLGEKRGGELHRYTGKGGGGRQCFLALGRGKCSRAFSASGSVVRSPGTPVPGGDAAAPVSPEGGVETPSRTRPVLSAQQRTCVRAVIVPLAVFRFTRSGSRLLIEIKYYEVDILGKPENEGKSPEGGVRKHRPESRHCRVPGP